MPLVSEDELKELLAKGQIGALTVDTNIFDEKRLRLSSQPLQSLEGLKRRAFPFILPETIAKEVQAHLVENAEEALREARKAIGAALGAFDTKKPTKDDILNQISGGVSAEAAASNRWTNFVKMTSCEVLEDHKLVDLTSVFGPYFEGKPPFGKGKKKSEFPDALALSALERAALLRSLGILVVSKDKGWQEFCEQSGNLYQISELERALTLINAAPLGLRKAVQSWMVNGEDGSEAFRHHLEDCVQRIDVFAYGHPSYGELEAYAFAGSLKDIAWPDADDLDIISINEPQEGEALELLVSVPLTLTIGVPVELSFSVWDGIDKEAVGLGGRDVEVDETLHTRATIALDIYDLESAEQEIVFQSCDLDTSSIIVDLGELDAFAPSDYWEEEVP